MRSDQSAGNIILLDRMVWSNSEQCSCWSIIRNANEAFHSRDAVVSYMLRPNVPRPRFTTVISKASKRTAGTEVHTHL